MTEIPVKEWKYELSCNAIHVLSPLQLWLRGHSSSRKLSTFKLHSTGNEADYKFELMSFITTESTKAGIREKWKSVLLPCVHPYVETNPYGLYPRPPRNHGNT